jgi:hypothetical protein
MMDRFIEESQDEAIPEEDNAIPPPAPQNTPEQNELIEVKEE